jgi:hypothetical protein
MVDSFSIDVKRGRRDLKFSINAKGGVCWSVFTGCCTGFFINVKLFAESSFGIREFGNCKLRDSGIQRLQVERTEACFSIYRKRIHDSIQTIGSWRVKDRRSKYKQKSDIGKQRKEELQPLTSRYAKSRNAKSRKAVSRRSEHKVPMRSGPSDHEILKRDTHHMIYGFESFCWRS